MSKAKVMLVLAGLGVALLIAWFLLSTQQPLGEKKPTNGTATAIEFGKAGKYGYLTFSYNGTGEVTLIALSERPKTNIIVLKKDFLSTERYPYFMKLLRSLERKGFSIFEVESIGAPSNSIILIPSGAMPREILERLDNLSESNTVIVIGKKNLVASGNSLLEEDWYSNISNESRRRIIVMEKTLEEFYTEKNYSIFSQIEVNAWAQTNSASFAYSGTGKRTVFIELNGATWLRMLPLFDSGELQEQPARITEASEIFPGQKASLVVSLNYSTGIAMYSIEKDGRKERSGELKRVRGEEAFFLVLPFESPGDYLVRIYDMNGTLGAARIHVKNLTITLTSAYGNAYEFEVRLDGKPLESADAIVGLSHSKNTVEVPVRNGKMLVHANLRSGTNIFVINMFGQRIEVPYENNQEGLIEFYAKTLIPGVLLVAGFYIALRLSKKPVYRIRVPESVRSGMNKEVRLKAAQIITVMEEIEAKYGWKGVPLYAKEIAQGLKALTNGMEVGEGNVEALMKKLEEKGLVNGYLGLYGLSSWGDPQQNALRRIVRDRLIQNGMDFTPTEAGFSCEEMDIVFDPENVRRESIVVFEDRDALRSYLATLPEKKRARLELQIHNGMVRLTSLDTLDELL